MGKPVKDLRDRRYGKLVVVSLAHTNGRRAHWHVLCECGRAKVVMASHLQSGATRTCGACANEALMAPVGGYRKNHG